MAIYMKYGALDGEVTTTGYEKWVECSSAQWGIGRGISSGGGGGSKREASAPSISEITLTTSMDSFSPLILIEAIGGKGVTVKLDFTRTDNDGKHVAYQKYILDGTMVSGYSVSSGGDRPSESLSLNFTKMTSEYFKIDDQFASTSAGKVIYDVALQKKT